MHVCLVPTQLHVFYTVTKSTKVAIKLAAKIKVVAAGKEVVSYIE